MKTLVRILALIGLLASPAIAQWGGSSTVVNVANPQIITALPGSATDDDLTKGGGGDNIVGGICSEFGHQVPCGNHYALTRASTKYCQTQSGLWIQVASGAFCLTNQGNLIEEARTNTALWARDMTNAAWVKVGMGTALNAVGIDGASNSATTLTATGTASSCTTSCTVLQTLTLGSSAENYSVWLKRVSGSGAVNITNNNLVGTTACTLVSTGFTRCTVSSTLANPVIGIQMVGLNDVIVADFNQLEAAAFPTSPIATTTVSVPRAADAYTASGAQFSGMNGAIIATVVSGGGNTGVGAGHWLIKQSGSETVNIFAEDFQVDVTTLARANGGKCFNTNVGAGTLGAAGVVECLGTASGSWHLRGNPTLAY